MLKRDYLLAPFQAAFADAPTIRAKHFTFDTDIGVVCYTRIVGIQ